MQNNQDWVVIFSFVIITIIAFSSLAFAYWKGVVGYLKAPSIEKAERFVFLQKYFVPQILGFIIGVFFLIIAYLNKDLWFAVLGSVAIALVVIGLFFRKKNLDVGIVTNKYEKNKKLNYVFFIIILVLFSIFGSIEKFYKRQAVLNPISQDKIAEQATRQNADWKTYKSDYGFELQYPNDWEIYDTSYTYDGKKNISVNVSSGVRYDLPGYQSIGARYIIQLQFFNNKVNVTNNEFVKAKGSQYVEEIALTNSLLRSTQEYQDAQKIIKTVICAAPLVCALPLELTPVTDEMITGFFVNSNPTIKKILRVDFDNDSREDAVVLTHTCGATCYDNVYVFLNKENGITSLDTSSIPLSKSIEISLQGKLLEIKTFDLAGSLQTVQMYEVINNKLTAVVGG